MDSRHESIISDVKFTYLKKTLKDYQGFFYNVYHSVIKKSVEEEHFEVLVNHLSNRTRDELTAQEALMLIDFIFKFPKHPLSIKSFEFFARINGTYYGVNILGLYKSKGLLSDKSLVFLYSLTSLEKKWLYDFITNWRLNESITHEAIALIMPIKQSEVPFEDTQLYKIIHVLNSNNLLNAETIKLIKNRVDILELVDLLEIIGNCKKNKIPCDIDNDFLVTFKKCYVESDVFLFKHLAEIGLLTKEIVNSVHDNYARNQINPILVSFKDHGLINKKNIEWAVRNKNHVNEIVHVFEMVANYYSLQELINDFPLWPHHSVSFMEKISKAVVKDKAAVLSVLKACKAKSGSIEVFLGKRNLLDNDLLTKINKFKDAAFNDDQELNSSIHLLDQYKILNPLTLNAVLNFYEHHKPDKQMGERLAKIIHSIWVPLSSKHNLLNYNNISTIFHLTEKKEVYIESLSEKIHAAIKCKVLSQISFDKIIKLHEPTLPKVTATEVTLSSKKLTQRNRSVVTVENKSIYIGENPKDAVGGFAKIKKGYLSDSDSEPEYCIKKFKVNDVANNVKSAKREVKGHLALGHKEAFFYLKPNKNQYHVVYTWQKGLPIYQVGNFINVSIEDRLYAISTFFFKLMELHYFHHRVHGDISVNNVIIDPKTFHMELIDCQLTRKKIGMWSNDGTRPHDTKNKPLGLYEDYLDPKHPFRFEFAGDIFAASCVVGDMFKDLFIYDKNHKEMKRISRPIGFGFDALEVAIFLLMDAMRAPFESRCTTKDAYDFCQKIREKQNTLTKKEVDAIAKLTLYRRKLTFDDAMLGKTKTLKIGS